MPSQLEEQALEETKPIPTVETQPQLQHAVEVSADKLMKSWSKQAEPDMTKRWEEPPKEPFPTVEPITEETAVTEIGDDLEQKKNEFLQYVDEPVKSILPTIPISLVGNIPEFTTNAVNTKALAEQMDNYCIDNRWHKSGKWYCIDVVNERARYFFNSRQNVSIQIPMSVLREWSKL